MVGAISGPLFVVLATRTSALIGAALIGGAAFAGFVLYSPYLAVALTAAVVPLERIGRFSNDSQMITFSLMRTMGLLGAASLLLNWGMKRYKLWTPAPVILYACYTLIGALTLIFTEDFTRGVQQTTTNIGNVLFLLLIANAIRSKAQVRLPIILWLITTLGIGLFSIYQWHGSTATVEVDRYDNSGYRSTDERFSTVMEDYGEFESIGAVRRVLGSTSSPAVYAINVILTLPFYLYLWRTSRSRWMALFATTGLLVGAYNVVLTNTRAGVAALAVVCVCTLSSRLVRHRKALVAAMVLITVSAIPFLPQALSNRLFNLDSWSASKSATLNMRLVYWGAAVDIIEEHWLFGIGVGNQIELPKRLDNMYMPTNTSVHNEYLETLVETGIIGYPFMVGFMILAWRRLRGAELHFRKLGDVESEFFLTAFRMGFITILFYALQCDVLHFTLKGFWLCIGLTFAFWKLSREPIAEPPTDRLERYPPEEDMQPA